MLAFPFRFQPNGRIATVVDDSDQADAQLIACLLLTRRGERPLIPEYGVLDPTYDTAGTDTGDVTASIAAFGPPVDVLTVADTPRGDGTSLTQITFSR